MGPIPVRSASLLTSGETRPVVYVHFSSVVTATPSHLLLSSCKDGLPILRDYKGDWLGTFSGHSGAIWQAKLSLDGKYALTASGDFTSKLFDTTSGLELNSFEHSHVVRSVDLNVNGLEMVSGGNEKLIRIYDLESGVSRVLLDGVVSHESIVKNVLFVDENVVISCGEGNELKIWDKRLNKLINVLTFNSKITSLNKTINSHSLTITTHNQIIFLDLHSFIPTTLNLNYSPSTASLHPIHHNTFVTGSKQDNAVRLHDITGKELEIGKAHFGPIHSVSFSPDGELYATASEDGTVRLWQTEPKSYGLWSFNP